MERDGPIADARQNFQDFVQWQDLSIRDTKIHRYAQEWLYDWIHNGDGVAQTGRSYETYLRVCLDIADATMRGEIDYGYRGHIDPHYSEEFYRREREVVAIHNPDSPSADYAERTTYEGAIAWVDGGGALGRSRRDDEARRSPRRRKKQDGEPST